MPNARVTLLIVVGIAVVATATVSVWRWRREHLPARRDVNAIEDRYRRFADKRFPLPTEAQASDLEERIGVTLPSDYREFLLRYNGGYFTEPDILAPSKECPQDRLTVLYGIGATDSSAELASAASMAIFDDNKPAQVVPIGHTIMGNLLVLITRPEERGSTVLKKAWSDDYYYLASGIEEFFRLLREPSDE
jgi:hypothetical protein